MGGPHGGNSSFASSVYAHPTSVVVAGTYGVGLSVGVVSEQEGVVNDGGGTPGQLVKHPGPKVLPHSSNASLHKNAQPLVAVGNVTIDIDGELAVVGHGSVKDGVGYPLHAA